MHILENGVFIAVVAQAIVGLTLVWDKVLLKQTHSQSVLNYVFWLGAIGIFGCLVGIFGLRMPGAGIIGIGLASGAVDLMGSWAYYKALRAGEASQTLALMGGFGPLATALIARALLKEQLQGMTIWGFAILVAGGFVMFLSHRINVRKMLPLILLGSGLLGLSNVLQKIAFNAVGFSTGFVLFSLGEFFFALLFLVRGTWRRQIFKQSTQAQPRNKIAYFVNRFFNGLGAFLISFAVSRAHPALVSAISGVRYAAIFIAVYLLTKYKPNWLKEVLTGWTLTMKLIATLLVIAGLAVVGAAGGHAGGGAGMGG
jgi:drug/metabolite transporter (DMT)-like permease